MPVDAADPATALRDAACAVCGVPLCSVAGGLLSLACPNGHGLAAALGESSERAPIRTLAPGIEQGDDTCDGRPRIAGTRLGTDAMACYWQTYVASGDGPGTAMRRVADDYHTTPEAVQIAVAFEAGRAWERERRAASKRERLAKKWRAGRDAAKGASVERID